MRKYIRKGLASFKHSLQIIRSSRGLRLNFTHTIPLSVFIIFLCLLVVFQSSSSGDTRAPSWLIELSEKPVPELPPETEAVYLWNEQSLTYKPDGLMIRRGRQAIKILRPGGIERARLLVRANTFNTKVRRMSGWVVNPDKSSRSLNIKDAISSSLAPDTLYWDVRLMALALPDVTRESLLGFEWEEEIQPISLEDVFGFQSRFPMLSGRYSLSFPSYVEPVFDWINWKQAEPKSKDDARQKLKNIEFEIGDVPAIQEEPLMPPDEAIAARLLVRLRPSGLPRYGLPFYTWKDMGLWYEGLSRERRLPNKAIKDIALELAGNVDNTRSKIERLAEFVQREIRYVSIQIGIGGYQPHEASSILENRYGDCKDKATLLAAMLESLGIESYYVIVNVFRQAVAPDSPVSLFSFNHAILAIKLQERSLFEGAEAIIHDPELGALLIFDPTMVHTPLGRLPYYLRGSSGLLVAGNSSKLIQLPASAAENNRLNRAGKFVLESDGSLSGEVTETLSGVYAERTRMKLQEKDEAGRKRDLEKSLSASLPSFDLKEYEFQNLDRATENLIIHYSFTCSSYVKRAGNFLNFRPGILEVLEDFDIFKQKEKRRYPVMFSSVLSGQDEFEIELPEDYALHQTPDLFEISNDFAEYSAQFELNQRKLLLRRRISIKQDFLPASRFEEVINFFGSVSFEGRRSLILKQE